MNKKSTAQFPGRGRAVDIFCRKNGKQDTGIFGEGLPFFTLFRSTTNLSRPFIGGARFILAMPRQAVLLIKAALVEGDYGVVADGAVFVELLLQAGADFFLLAPKVGR